MVEAGQPGGTAAGGPNRRVHPRYAILIKGRADHVGLVGATGFDIVASDISEGGMLLHTDQGATLSVEDILRVKFSPLRGGEAVVLQVRVVWRKDDVLPRLGRTSFGCLFFRTPLAAINEVLLPAREANELKLTPEAC